MNKKYILIGGGLIALVVAFIFWKKQQPKSADEVLEGAMEDSSKTMTSLYTANKKAVDPSQYSQADTDYNDAVRRYQLKYKSQPDASWTTDEIEQRIADYDTVMDYIDQYLDLNAKYFNGQSQYTEKELSRKNATELKSIVKNRTTESKMVIWNARKADIERIVEDFKTNFTNFGTWAGDAAPYDLVSANALLALPKNERVYANLYFSQIGGIVTADNWHDYNNKTAQKYTARTISEAIMRSDSSVFRDRAAKNPNKQEAMTTMTKLKNEYVNVSGTLNGFGELV